jgi:hypothetical protein
MAFTLCKQIEKGTAGSSALGLLGHFMLLISTNIDQDASGASSELSCANPADLCSIY